MNIWTKLAMFSFFETDRLYLRPFFFSDSQDFYEIASNPENLQFIFPTQASLEESQYALANYFMKSPLGVWAICDQKNQQMIGSIKFEKIDEIKKEAELGYFLKKEAWSQGFMTEVVKKLCQLSFEEFDLKQLSIITHLENEASQKVALKSGFSLFRQFKGSDRYTRKMRDYLEFRYVKENSMSKHQEILSYLEELPVGKRVSVRSISNHLGVSDGTAYRAIKEAENRGIVETRPRSGTIRVKSQKVAIERLTFAEIAEVTSSEILAGQEGLEREFSKFSIGAMTEQNILSYLHDGGLLIVGDRTRIQLLALENENAVLVTGGFQVHDDVLKLANQKGIPVLRSKHDTFTVATMINKALSNVQIKTDILTVEKLYRPSHEYGFLRETDTVKDYLDLVRKNRSSRFPVINQHQVVVGVVTMRDAGDKSPSTTIDKVMSRSLFLVGLSTNIANVSQRMIAEDFEMVPVVRNNQTLLGVVTRRDVMEKMSRSQVSALPTFSEQIGQKLSYHHDEVVITVEPFMLEKNGVLANGVLAEILTHMTQDLVVNSGRNLIIEQMLIYFLQAVQIDDILRIQARIIHHTRRSAIIDYDIYHGHQIVSKANVTVKIN